MKTKWMIFVFALIFGLSLFAGANEKMEFPVAVSSRVLGFAPLWAADKKGFFDREGLDVTVTTTRGTSPSMQALAAESVHAALASNDGVIGLVEKGLDLAIIAGGSKTTHMIIGGKNIESYEDLRGTVIGSSTLTSGTAFLLRRVLREKGLEYPKDYSLVNVGGSGPSLIALVQSGTKRYPKLPDVPTLYELMEANKTSDANKRVAIVLLSSGDLGRPFFGPPGMAADQLKILREAFTKTMNDEALLAEAKKKKWDLDPRSGEDLEALAKEIMVQPPEVIERVKKVLGN
jgi:hypothetical protein